MPRPAERERHAALPAFVGSAATSSPACRPWRVARRVPRGSPRRIGYVKSVPQHVGAGGDRRVRAIHASVHDLVAPHHLVHCSAYLWCARGAGRRASLGRVPRVRRGSRSVRYVELAGRTGSSPVRSADLQEQQSSRRSAFLAIAADQRELFWPSAMPRCRSPGSAFTMASHSWRAHGGALTRPAAGRPRGRIRTAISKAAGRKNRRASSRGKISLPVVRAGGARAARSRPRRRSSRRSASCRTSLAGSWVVSVGLPRARLRGASQG